MARGPNSFKASDLTRALKAAKAAGFNNPRVEIKYPSGCTMVVAVGQTPLDKQDANPWDVASE